MVQESKAANAKSGQEDNQSRVTCVLMWGINAGLLHFSYVSAEFPSKLSELTPARHMAKPACISVQSFAYGSVPGRMSLLKLTKVRCR